MWASGIGQVKSEAEAGDYVRDVPWGWRRAHMKIGARSPQKSKRQECPSPWSTWRKHSPRHADFRLWPQNSENMCSCLFRPDYTQALGLGSLQPLFICMCPFLPTPRGKGVCLLRRPRRPQQIPHCPLPSYHMASEPFIQNDFETLLLIFLSLQVISSHSPFSFKCKFENPIWGKNKDFPPHDFRGWAGRGAPPRSQGWST